MVQIIGDTRYEMSRDLIEKKLPDVIELAHKEKGLDEMWIVVSARFDDMEPNIIREGIVVCNKRPPNMLNSMCFHAIYSKGLLEPTWILPKDHGFDINVEQEDGHSSVIEKSLSDLGGTKILT